MAWRIFRSDAYQCWESGHVQNALPNYYNIIMGRKQAKYLIAKRLAVDLKNPQDISTETLIEIHESMKKEFSSLPTIENLGIPEYSFLDLKIEIAKRVLASCEFCERKCKIDRKKNKGHCRIGGLAKVSSAFAHTGEEAPLVPSGTIFFTGCTLDCVFCQNYDISSVWKEKSDVYIDNVDGKRLFKITNDLIQSNSTYPLKNINYVGGDPTPNIHIILESLKHFDQNIPLIWNSNFFNSNIAISLLMEIIDLWLPDFKFGNNNCGLIYSGVNNYFDILSRNLNLIYQDGKEDIIIRHLLMPGHIDCCTASILKFVRDQIPKVQVNIMEQYRPQFKVNTYRYAEINRRCSKEEIDKAFQIAMEYGINYKLCS